MSKSFYLSIFCLLLSACTSPPTRNAPGNPYTLGNAEKIKVGVSRENDVKALLGTPTLALAGVKSNGWLFCEQQECSRGRITVQLDPKSSLVIGVAWNTRSGDPEQNLEKAVSLYPGTHFSERRMLLDYGRYMETVTSYLDEAEGISLEYDAGKHVVTSIIWRAPNTKSDAVAQDSRGYPIVSILSERSISSSK